MRFNIKMVHAICVGILSLSSNILGATARVTITDDLRFVPDHIKISIGDNIEFVNESRFNHTVTADPSLVKNSDNVQLPEGAVPFNSGLLTTGKMFNQTFTVPGNYRYTCLPHEMFGMQGQIEVASN